MYSIFHAILNVLNSILRGSAAQDLMYYVSYAILDGVNSVFASLEV